MKKIVTVIGARPQFIKAAAVSSEIRKHSNIKEIIVHTGQHFDENMSEIFFQQMNIPRPDYNLNINSLGHGAMTGQMLQKIEEIILSEKPDLLMVYGDTNSTLAGALAAAKLHVQVAHIEAGLRSFNMKMPEEINRILTDRISNYLFCPTDTAMKNLEKEGFQNFNCKIIKSGDVMQDAVLLFSEHARKPQVEIPARFNLCTIHRQENTDDKKRFRSIIESLNIISEETPVVLPLHPRTRKKLESEGMQVLLSEKLIIIEPVGYLEMLYLLKNCKLVLTDSGGLQKEAFFFAKPCVTLREETEWTELVENGYNVIAGWQMDSITSNYKKMCSVSIRNDENLFGGGKASSRIVNELSK